MKSTAIDGTKKIIHVDEDLCIGCGQCVDHCRGGALELVDGKAKLMREDHCDYLGNCLPICPTGAISFVDRVVTKTEKGAATMKKVQLEKPSEGCPGSTAKSFADKKNNESDNLDTSLFEPAQLGSRLGQWPVQIQLVPEKADFYNGKPLVIAADCSAFAYGNFHNEFIKNSTVIIGCPKLDSVEYKNKLQKIIENNDITGLSIVRMEVPCCGGIEYSAKEALRDSKKFIPWNVFTISIDGKIL